MRKGCQIVIAAVLMATPLLPADGALAATEVGNDCEANGMVVGATLFPLANGAGSLLPVSAPVAGIATQWKVKVHPSTDIHAERLMVLRPTTDPKQLQVVAESSLENVTGGQNSFDVSIPIEPGDRFAVSGRPGGGAIACLPPRPGDVAGIFFGDTPLGSKISFAEEGGAQPSVTAVIEPDADLDGYGDETQDSCPQSGVYFKACPRVTIAFWAKPRKRSILAHVMATAEATVQVYGQVGWGIRPKPKPGPGGSPAKARLIVGLSGGRARDVAGEDARYAFRIQLPKPVLRRLGRLTPDESLQAKLAARYTDLAGRTEVERVTVTLKGRNRS
jgi:hypothetical protein